MNKTKIFALLMAFLFVAQILLTVVVPTRLDIQEVEALDPVTTRGECHEKTDYHNYTFTFTTGLPCFVNAGTEENPNYQPFITYEGLSFSDDEYRIGNTRVGYSVWKSNGSVTFWDSDNFVDIKVKQETWKVYYNESATVWADTEIDDVTPTIVFTTNTTHNKVSITKSNSEGILKVDYILMAGKPLKHDIYWTNNSGETKEYKVLQSWYDIVGADRVKHVAASNATAYYYFAGQALKTKAEVGTNFIFEDSNGDLIINENQGSASMFFTDVLFIRSNGIESVEFNFNNQTTLTDGGTFVIDPSTLDDEPRLSADGHSGIYLPQNDESGDDCLRDTSRPTWYQDEAHGIMQIGPEDSNRCYVVQLMFHIGDICDGASDGGSAPYECDGIYVSAVYLDFPVTSDSEMVSYCNDDPCTTRVKITMLGLAKQKGHGMCGDSSSYGSGTGKTPNRLAQSTGNDGVLNAGAADMVMDNQNPISTGDAWSGVSLLLDGNSSYANEVLQADLRDSSGDQETCFGLSEVGNPQKGSGHQFYRVNYPTLSVTYSTSPPVSYYDTQIDLMMYDDNTNVTIGDPEVRFASRNGTLSAWTNCTKTIASGTVGVCHVSTDSAQSGDIRMWVRWAGNGETCSSCNGLKIEGQDSYNFTAATMMLKLQVSIYKNTTLNFHDDGGTRNTPQNFTIQSGHNASSQTITSFAHDGAKTIGYTTNGTSGSENRGGSAATAADRGTAACVTLKTCNRMVKIYELGNDRIANQTAYFNVTADNQVVSFRQKVYLLDFDFTSSNRALQSIVPSAISFAVSGNGSAVLASSGEFTFSGGTLCTGVEDGAGCRAGGAGKFQFGNDTILMKAIRYQGTNMVENSGSNTTISTGVVVSASGKHSFTLRYYPMTWLFQADGSSPAFPIVPAGFTFEGVNATGGDVGKLELDGTSDTPYIAYSGNGTINPEGVTAFGQGMIGSSQANIVVTTAASNTLNLQYYRTTFAFQSADTELTLVPSAMTFTSPNGTKLSAGTQVTDFTKYYYMGNGTLNPEGVTYLGQGMIGAAQADLTISAAATHTLSLQYYEITFVFKSSDNALTLVPSDFTFEAPNATKRVITDWSPHARGAGHYIGNGTLNPEGVTYHDQGMIGSSQANIAISAESTKTLTLQYYKQTLSFPSIDGLITIVPTNFQVVLSNSTEKTLNNTALAFPPHIYVGNGTATPRGITYQGAGVINSQASWAVDADETITNQVQLYKKIFTFESDDLLLTITPSAFQYTAPNGTQIVQTSNFNGHVNEGVYLGNGTLTPQGITYQGSGMSKNVTSITISIDSDPTTGGNQNEHLWRLRYYAIPLGFTSFDTVPDGGIQNITPEGFTFTPTNASAVCCEITDFTKTLYLGNGTVTPGGITYLNQGMIQNNTAISITQSEVMGGGFRLKFFKLNFEFQSDDLALNITPTLFQYTAPNGTVVTQSANYNVHFIGNGTLTQKGIKYQGTGMVKNITTTVTVDASESHMFRMKYYTQNFVFRSTLSSNIITPTNLIMTLANGTQVTLTSYTGYYFGNQTVASVDTLTFGGLNAKQNSTGFAIATNNDSWLLWAIECCTVSFNFASVGHILDNIQPSTFEFDMGNGTYVVLTDFTDAQFSDGDTVTPRAIRFQGQNMILNSTIFTINDSAGLTQTFLINIQYYKVNWDFVSVDSELDLYATLTNFQYVAPNGTAITQNSDFINTFLGNGTLNPVTLVFKGQGVLVNNTGITIDGVDLDGVKDGSETHLIRAQWYKVAFTFTSNDGALTIIPQHIQFMAPNGTVIVFTNHLDFGDHYVGNGTLTPQGITYQDTGMIQSGEAAFTVSGAMTKAFTLQYYKVTFDFKSWDSVLNLTPTNFKAVVANSTTPFTATHTVLYLGNGTLIPHVITYQGQNIIQNMDAITIDADETYTIRGRYYAISFDFLTTAGTDSIKLTIGDAPDNFIFNLGNGTEVIITDDTVLDSCFVCVTARANIYIANQTLTPFSILWDGTSIHENQTAISITTDENLSFRTKVYNVNFLFTSSDSVLTITPDSFTFFLSNGTASDDSTYVNITIPNRADGWLLANGTLTPNKIRFQGQNMLNSNSPITIDATETHTLLMNYYPIIFNFASTFEDNPGQAHNIVPTSMMFTGGNGTQTTATSFTSAIYLGNQTGFRIDAINFQGTNMNHNGTTITISGAGTNLLRMQYVPIKAQVQGFGGVQTNHLIEQIFVFNVNGTNTLILTEDNGTRKWWSGNGTLEIAPAWQDIRIGLNYSTVHSSSNFFDTIGSGDELESGGNATIITMPSRIFEIRLPPCSTIKCTGTLVGWFAVEDTDVSCQIVTRTNSTCILFGENRLKFETTGISGPKTLVMMLLSHEKCVSGADGIVRGTCLTQPNAVLVNTTNYEFPENDWTWDGINKVFRFSMPMSTTNTTIALFANATIGASEFIVGLESANTCLKTGDLICTITTPYTRSGSLGLWFYGIMMMMPIGMVWLRTGSLGPTSVLMIVLIWIFGTFAPSIMGTTILPPNLLNLSRIFVVLSIAITLYKLFKRD